MVQGKVDNLTKYGQTFQSKVIASLVKDKKFLDKVIELLTTDFFESRQNKELVRIIEKYYKKYRRPPSMEAFKLYIDKIENDSHKSLVVKQLRNVYTYIDSQDLEFVQDEFLEFAKNQKLKVAIFDSVDLLKLGKYDAIKNKIDEAMKAGDHETIGHDYIKDIENRLKKSVRDTVPTKWNPINELMDGGLGPGELGVVVGGPGVGKSWVLSNIGLYGLETGKNVIHYTLELNEEYTGLRYDSSLLGISSRDLREYPDKIKNRIKGLEESGGNLVIKRFPPHMITINTLRSHIQRVESIGGKVDLVIVDYADLMRSVEKRSTGSYEELGGIYTELRGLSAELEIPVWTGSQANRDSLEMEIVQAESIAESFKKLMVSDFVISLARKNVDKVSDTARFHVIKNRFGPDGITFPAKMDTSIGHIEIYEPKSSDGIQAIADQKIANGDVEKAYLRKKLGMENNKKEENVADVG